MSSRIEVIARVSGRRYWTALQKLAMLRDAFGPGGCVRTAMELHEVSSGQLYTWRRQAMSGELSGRPITAPSLPTFAEVQITDVASAVPAVSAVSSSSMDVGPTTRIGIELPSGVRLTVDTGVDADALRRVLSVFAQ